MIIYLTKMQLGCSMWGGDFVFHNFFYSLLYMKMQIAWSFCRRHYLSSHRVLIVSLGRINICSVHYIYQEVAVGQMETLYYSKFDVIDITEVQDR